MQTDFCYLQNGTTLNCASGTITVKEYIGRGGQGEVYRVSINGKDYALKYYFPKNCKAQFKESLSALIELLKNNPVNSRSYVWPLCLVENGDQFGYVMELLPKKYCFVSDYLDEVVNPSDEILLRVCANLSSAFRELHVSGYSYKDISYGNVAFDLDNGDVLIFDNDNVTKNNGKSFVTGTPKFIAPELVFDEKNIVPSRSTDLHSLAVLMFIILFGEHPLEGAKSFEIPGFVSDYDLQIYGPDHAKFIFADKNNLDRYIYCNNVSDNDKEDYENYKDHIKKVKTRWKAISEEIQDLFRTTFVDGIKNPSKRVPPLKWAEAFSRASLKNNSNNYEQKSCPTLQVFNKESTGRRQEKLVHTIAISNQTDIGMRCFPGFNANLSNVLLVAQLDGDTVKIENVSGVELYFNGRPIGKNRTIVLSKDGDNFRIYDKDQNEYKCKIIF